MSAGPWGAVSPQPGPASLLCPDGDLSRAASGSPPRPHPMPGGRALQLGLLPRRPVCHLPLPHTRAPSPQGFSPSLHPHRPLGSPPAPRSGKHTRQVRAVCGAPRLLAAPRLPLRGGVFWLWCCGSVSSLMLSLRRGQRLPVPDDGSQTPRQAHPEAPGRPGLFGTPRPPLRLRAQGSGLSDPPTKFPDTVRCRWQRTVTGPPQSPRELRGAAWTEEVGRAGAGPGRGARRPAQRAGAAT